MTKKIIVVLLASLIGGCWSWEPIQKTQKVSVTTIPDKAVVWQNSPKGRVELGMAPGEFEVTHQATVGRFSHWKWLGTVLSAGATAGGIYWASTAGIADDPGQTLGATFLIMGGVTGLIITAIFNVLGELRNGTEIVEPVELGVMALGYGEQSTTLDFPVKNDQLAFALKPTTSLMAQTQIKEPEPQTVSRNMTVPKERPNPSKSVIVAVFNVYDASERVETKVLDQLTTYLTTVVAMLPEYRVIPREQLRLRLAKTKAEGYKSCFEQSCQIEMGKAMSAQKTLSTQVLRIGEKCAITANLFDLKTETAEKAAMVETRCSLEELMDAMKALAYQLSDAK